MNTIDEKTFDVIDEKTFDVVDEKMSTVDILHYNKEQMVSYVENILSREYFDYKAKQIPFDVDCFIKMQRSHLYCYAVVMQHIITDKSWTPVLDTMKTLTSQHLKVFGQSIIIVVIRRTKENSECITAAYNWIQKSLKQMNATVWNAITNVLVDYISSVVNSENFKLEENSGRMLYKMLAKLVADIGNSQTLQQYVTAWPGAAPNDFHSESHIIVEMIQKFCKSKDTYTSSNNTMSELSSLNKYAYIEK